VALDLGKVLLGLVGVFVLYSFAGIVRRIEWRDSKVGKPWLAIGIAIAFVGIWIVSVKLPEDTVFWLVIAFVVLFVYRLVRQFLGYHLFLVGVDVDGVLAEQINPVLDLLRKQGKA